MLFDSESQKCMEFILNFLHNGKQLQTKKKNVTSHFYNFLQTAKTLSSMTRTALITLILLLGLTLAAKDFYQLLGVDKDAPPKVKCLLNLLNVMKIATASVDSSKTFSPSSIGNTKSF